MMKGIPTILKKLFITQFDIPRTQSSLVALYIGRLCTGRGCPESGRLGIEKVFIQKSLLISQSPKSLFGRGSFLYPSFKKIGLESLGFCSKSHFGSGRRRNSTASNYRKCSRSRGVPRRFCQRLENNFDIF